MWTVAARRGDSVWEPIVSSPQSPDGTTYMTLPAVELIFTFPSQDLYSLYLGRYGPRYVAKVAGKGESLDQQICTWIIHL